MADKLAEAGRAAVVRRGSVGLWQPRGQTLSSATRLSPVPSYCTVADLGIHIPVTHNTYIRTFLGKHVLQRGESVIVLAYCRIANQEQRANEGPCMSLCHPPVNFHLPGHWNAGPAHALTDAPLVPTYLDSLPFRK